MTRKDFVRRYGSIYEHSAWVAEQAYEQAATCENLYELAAILANCVDTASHQKKLALIRAHPDLAGKAAIAGELTEESNEEQASAGIDQCSPAEFASFQKLNESYRKKFSFPFVMAVRDSNRREILEAFAERLGNDHGTEFTLAIAEIHKIARLRLQAQKES